MSFGTKRRQPKSLYYLFAILTFIDIISSVVIVGWLFYFVKPSFADKTGFVALFVIIVNLIVVVLLAFLIHQKIFKHIHNINNKISGIYTGAIEKVPTSDDELVQIETAIDKIDAMINKRIEDQHNHEKKRKSLMARISHDLRMPLTSIIGYVEAIQDGIVSESNLSGHLDIILDRSNHLNHMIDDLDVLSKSELAELQMHKTRVLSDDLLNSFFESHKSPDHIILQLKRPFIGAYIMADQYRFYQIIGNILHNAQKYAVSNIIVTTDIKNDMLVITVEDDGPGIPAELHHVVFDQFYMVSKNEEEPKRAGSGLGLTIVKQLVESHDGLVEIIDKQGGLKIEISFPIDYS